MAEHPDKVAKRKAIIANHPCHACSSYHEKTRTVRVFKVDFSPVSQSKADKVIPLGLVVMRDCEGLGVHAICRDMRKQDFGWKP